MKTKLFNTHLPLSIFVITAILWTKGGSLEDFSDI